MRHYLFLLLLLLLGTALFAPSAEGDGLVEGVPVTVPRDAGGSGVFGPLQPALVPVELERLGRTPVTTLAPVDHAADFCSNATPLAMIDGTDGDSGFVDGMSVSPTDPLLTCMEGAPQSLQGYRTVWYRFEAPASGRLVITTNFDPDNYRDSYDTVLALYHTDVKNDVDLACANLEMVACDDDSEGFLSETATFVHQGEWYFIEVAAWHLAAEGYELRLAVVLENVESLWDTWQPPGAGDDWFWREARSRHMVVTDGTHIYVISGETVVEDRPEITANVSRLTPATGEWITDGFYPVPHPAYPGYSRTSAAYLSGNIYIPAGYVGDDQFYAGDHLRYTVATDEWNYPDPVEPDEVLAPIPGNPYAWAEAVAAPNRSGYYLVGGLLAGDPDPSFPSDAEPTNDLLFYSVPADTWNTSLPSMETARYAHVAALLEGGRVCAAGGIGKESTDEAVLLSSAECYSAADGDWTPIASLNRPRFSAGSAVGPDGRWYVFGGATVTECGDDQCFAPETITEVYDPLADTWTMLDARYSIDEPGRAWPRGVFVGNTLWIFGGETVGTDPPAQVVPLIQRLTALPPRTSDLWASDTLYMPVIAQDLPASPFAEPNDIFDQAQPIALYQTAEGDFAAPDDFFDIYRFRITDPGVYVATVTSIPVGHNYDIYLFNANKYRVGYGETIGNNDETATTLPLAPGTYYALVVRVFGGATTDNYQIMIRPQ